jgi:ANTAR domain
MISEPLALEIAQLGLVGRPSESVTLRSVTDLAVRTIPGCVGATAVRWTRMPELEPLFWAASHPSLADLVGRQISARSGPIFDAVTGGVPHQCGDTLIEARWPQLIPAMLQAGVRCFTTTLHDHGSLVLTLTVYGVVPGAIDGNEPALSALLLGQGSAAVSNARQYGRAHRTAIQLQEAVESRAVVDQAKGILMHALGCTAEEAFQELKRISQSSHTKVTTIARRIVSGERS